MRIGFDIDGVLAAFVPAYQKLFVETTGRDTFLPGDNVDPPSWDWPLDRGYTKEESRAVWERIKADGEFWFDLDAMEPNVTTLKESFEILDANHELYFITSRPGTIVKVQTEEWLCQKLGLLTTPTVLIVGHRVKGLICKALNLDAYVDDNYDNVMDCVLDSPRTHTYLLDARYNRVPNLINASNLIEANRIPDLATFLHRESLLG